MGVEVNSAPPSLPGIEIVSKIGEGGMSTVWKGIDLRHGRVVAVKVLDVEFTKNAKDVERFESEERTMELLDHAGIVKSYEMRHTDGMWYYIMEYVDGYNFRSLLDRKRHLPELDCLLICESVSVALDYAWSGFGIVHCDIKPENIMINSEGEVKLTDLGLSHTFQHLKNGALDVPDHVLGTPAYISPEQIYGDCEPDCRADIYSLAATIFHLATGRVLFPGLDAEGMMRSHCSDACHSKDPRFYRPELSEGFCQLLEAMLVKDREMRIGDWKEVYSLARDVENGVKFKPRAGGASSLGLGAGL